MNRPVPKRKYVVFCFLSIVFGSVTASGQTKSNNLREIVKRLDHTLVPTVHFVARSIIDRKAMADRKAYEAYEKRNAEITPWEESSIPQTPDNAALLYYQALKLERTQ